jgi:homoserine kinase
LDEHRCCDCRCADCFSHHNSFVLLLIRSSEAKCYSEFFSARFSFTRGGFCPEMKRVRVSVPASTSNLGSGFDTLGLAVNLRLTLDTEVAERIEFGAGVTSTAEPLIREAFEACATDLPGLRVAIQSEVPVGRGLGASAALRVGVIAAALTLSGQNTDAQRLLELGYSLEHHPDNVSPAIYGGFTVSGRVDGRTVCQRFAVGEELKLVTLIPDFEMPTGEARRLLPDGYPRADTAHALNRAALVTAAFASGNYESLRGVFDDRLHQPYRAQLIPALNRVIEAGERAGAIGGFLSGAGSGIICLALGREEAIACAMQGELPNSVVRVLAPENRGILIN